MARPSKKNPTGAQKSPKRTQEVIDKLEKAFSIGCSDNEACIYADISHTTFYDWKKSDPKLFARFAGLKHKPVLKARMVVVDAINNKDLATAKWYIERKCRDEFGVPKGADEKESAVAAVSDLLKEIARNVPA